MVPRLLVGPMEWMVILGKITNQEEQLRESVDEENITLVLVKVCLSCLGDIQDQEWVDDELIWGQRSKEH